MRIPEIYLLDGTLQSLRIPKTTNVGEPKIGSLGVNADLVLCEYNGGGDWSPVVDTTDDLYSFTTHTFLGIPANDWNIGPTLSQCATAYSGKPFIGDLTLFNCINGIQIWTVPSNGTYRIQSRGGSNRNLGGGVDITTVLAKGNKLRMIVGRAYTGSFNYIGCGASVVVLDNGNDHILLSVAAGGGGSASNSSTVRNTSVTVDNPGSGAGGAAGSNGSSGKNTVMGGGGGGFLGDGFQTILSSYGRKAGILDTTSENSGLSGVGVYINNSNVMFPGFTGCFGGGGGSALTSSSGTTYFAIGGGGGYSGGSAVFNQTQSTSTASAYPGTNYALAGLISRSAFLPPQYSDGQIIITKLS